VASVNKLIKLSHVLLSSSYRRCLLTCGVAAGVEHEPVLRTLDCRAVVDIGANRGQFALVARQCFPQATIFSFEPLPGPAMRFRRHFDGDPQVTFHETAIGLKNGVETMHVSRKDDSSSILPITALQAQMFRGTEEVGQETVEIGPLDKFLSPNDIVSPALLKVDVQGYELEALKGCESLLGRFAYVYVECSFVELYAGQAGADAVIAFLQDRRFGLNGIYNMTYDGAGRAIQGDFLFAANGKSTRATVARRSRKGKRARSTL
jgi:FkbM family methyltransferase